MQIKHELGSCWILALSRVFSTWLANIVPVKKTNVQIRDCIDFRDLKKVCLKDEFSLSNKDMLVDATVGPSMFFFMDGFSCYNYIKMDSLGIENTVFRLLWFLLHCHDIRS